MKVRFRAWWRSVRQRASALWTRIFSRASSDSRGLSAPLADPVVEQAETESTRSENRNSSVIPILDAEIIELEEDVPKGSGPGISTVGTDGLEIVAEHQIARELQNVASKAHETEMRVESELPVDGTQDRVEESLSVPLAPEVHVEPEVSLELDPEVHVQSEVHLESEVSPDPEVPPVVDDDSDAKVPSDPAVHLGPEIPPGIAVEPEVSLEPEVHVEPEISPDPEVHAEPEISPDPEVHVEPEVSLDPEVHVEPEIHLKPEVPSEPEVPPAVDGHSEEPEDVTEAADSIEQTTEPTGAHELEELEEALAKAEEEALAAASLRSPPKARRTPREKLASHELECWRRLTESERARREKSIDPVDVPNDYVPMAESGDFLFQLNLSRFEGPLDLLLFLIRRHKIDVFDIPIGFVCAQYLRFIKMMEDLNIDVASEFLFMASELLHIKSRMLLPKPAEVEDEEDIDPRAELVQRLLDYQKYKRAAAELGEYAWLGRDTFPRLPEKLPAREGQAPLKEVGVFALIEAFNRVLEQQKPEVRHQVLLEQVSVRQRIKQLLQDLVQAESVPFEVLLDGLVDKIDIVVTFLACLEMGKRQLLRLYLSDNETLYLQPRFNDIDTAMGRLEGLDEHEYA